LSSDEVCVKLDINFRQSYTQLYLMSNKLSEEIAFNWFLCSHPLITLNIFYLSTSFPHYL